MIRRIIGKGWDDFESKVFPPDAIQAHRQELRGAFYSGAIVLFRIMEQIGGMDEEQGVPIIEDIGEELRAFAERGGRDS